jgi:hypothetical protein
MLHGSFTRARIIPSGGLSYLDFHGSRHPGAERFVRRYLLRNRVIWERDLGIAHKFLTSPTPRRGVSVRQGAVGQPTQLVANLDAPLDLFSLTAPTPVIC